MATAPLPQLPVRPQPPVPPPQLPVPPTQLPVPSPQPPVPSPQPPVPPPQLPVPPPQLPVPPPQLSGPPPQLPVPPPQPPARPQPPVPSPPQLPGPLPLLLVLGLALLATAGGGGAAASSASRSVEDVTARDFLAQFDTEAQALYYAYALADWDYNTNVTDANAQASNVKAAEWSEFYGKKSAEARQFDLSKITDRTLKQQLEILREEGSGALSPDKYAQLNAVMGNMSNIYSTSRICYPDDPSKCLRLDPELEALMASSLDYDERLWAWEGWHRQVGLLMRPLYEQYVELKNEVATLNGYMDYGDYWRGNYEVKEEFAGGPGYAYSRRQLMEEVQTLYNTVEPLYKELHAYVRRKLRNQYGSKVSLTGGLPAHLLGDMWGRFWTNLNSLATPFPDKPSVDVTPQMVAKGWQVKTMFESADHFFQSIGLQPMGASFWNHSMLVRPEDGREVVCHPTAWDMGNGQDFRIKMCGKVNMDDFLTAHHEMGHLQYDMEYAPLPWLLRDGANEGFHEAVGEIMSLSAATPAHLGKLGLLPPGFTDDEETDMNFLLKQALTIVATLPFTLSLEQWRWKVFSGDIPRNEWMKTWWQMKREMVGVVEPILHNEDYCDPAALFHVANDYSFIRYYTRTILQFQFQVALCAAAGHKGPVYKCDINGSKEAGEKLINMLKLGKSEAWTKALEQVASTTAMDSTALIDYFEPLYRWLQEDNHRHGQTVGWDPDWAPYMNEAMKVRISLKAEMGDDAYEWNEVELYLFRSVTAYAMRKYSRGLGEEVQYDVDNIVVFRETPRVSFYFLVRHPGDASTVVPLADVQAAVR
ncbi:angiotensin-converting enzyme 2-like [Petromyzon marinus]|uniref:angiotensin-converting enzyme 2-like n=1 Tax=Petromyzon marinus TaxID=7757 RepID=UPI003F6E59D0